jgi:hypothetical protein
MMNKGDALAPRICVGQREAVAKMRADRTEHPVQRRSRITAALPRPAERRKSSLQIAALNSMAWSEASEEERRKFVSNVGLEALWRAAGQVQRVIFIQRVGLVEAPKGSPVIMDAN